MPTIPMDAAKATRIVLAFFDQRLARERLRDVPQDMEGFRSRCFSPVSSASVQGLESFVIRPSFSFTIRVAYFFASFGLCVTMTTR